MPVIIDGTNGITSPGGDSNTSLTSSSFVSVGSQKLGAGNATRFKNRIINGDMRIDQRNAGASITANNGTYGVDRFKMSMTQSSKGTIQQNAGSITPPAGYINYLGFTSTSAYTVGSTDTFQIAQYIEGLNIADLAWGTADAKTVTLSFWVRSSLTGTFAGALNNSAFARSYPFTYSIPVANTWTQISITIAGDTTGTWLTTNGRGILLSFSLGVGSSYNGTANTWQAGDYETVSGAVSVVGTNGATFYITGVQLEVGSAASAFEYVDYTTQLAMCGRYYQVVDRLVAVTNISSNFPSWSIPVPMRTTPTVTPANISGSGVGFSFTSTGGYQSTNNSVDSTFTLILAAEL